MNMWSLNTPDEMVIEMPAKVEIGLGQCVAIGSNDGYVMPASNTQIPLGISLSDGGETCKVKVKGIIDVQYVTMNPPKVGWANLTSNDGSMIRVAGSGEIGRPGFILSVDTHTKTMRVLLL